MENVKEEKPFLESDIEIEEEIALTEGCNIPFPAEVEMSDGAPPEPADIATEDVFGIKAIFAKLKKAVADQEAAITELEEAYSHKRLSKEYILEFLKEAL